MRLNHLRTNFFPVRPQRISVLRGSWLTHQRGTRAEGTTCPHGRALTDVPSQMCAAGEAGIRTRFIKLAMEARGSRYYELGKQQVLIFDGTTVFSSRIFFLFPL